MITEHELLRAAHTFDEYALAEVYDLYSPRLYRYAARLLGNVQAAEDCVAETFNRFLKALQAGRGPRDHLQAYLFRTAHNWIVDHYRRAPESETLKDDLPDDVNVEESARLNLRQERVRAALGQLTSDQQQVIALKYLEDWDNEEIARAVHKPVGAVKSLQHRALERLKKLLLDEA